MKQKIMYGILALAVLGLLMLSGCKPTVDYSAPTLERCNEVRQQDISAGHKKCGECFADKIDETLTMYSYNCYN